MMTIAGIRAGVEEIRQCADDPEAAHSMEDMLYANVLAFIATGACTAEYAAKLADAALQTKTIAFARWCA